MLYHKDGNFIFDSRAAVRLPNGMCLCDNPDVVNEDGLELIAPDGSFMISVNFLHAEKRAETFLKEALEEFDAKEPICTVHQNGMTGCYATYQTKHEKYEEYVLELPHCEGKQRALLNFWFLTLKKGSERDVSLYHRVRADFLNGLSII